MLKKLFYASASILMLAIAYHLGAVSAKAQTNGLVQVGDIDAQFARGIAAVSGRTVYTANVAPFRPYGASAPVPGIDPVVAVDGADGIVMLANGDVYATDTYGVWQLQGNMIPGPTPAARPTWGQLKATYRK